ncbi:MAG: stage II sporulation protein M [Firmicutes bacterium]|nr:stage II sporulation protein M [Bacillota bacterium]
MPVDSRRNFGFILLALCFLAGAGLGAYAGSFAGTSSATAFRTVESFGDVGYIKLLWDNVRFHLIAILLATTFLGVVLLPALSALRGYFIGCTASVLFCGGGGFPPIAAVLGFPLLVCLPCFFVLTADAFRFSARTLAFVRRTGESARPPKLAAHALLCLSLVAAWTFAQLFAAPWLTPAFLSS